MTVCMCACVFKNRETRPTPMALSFPLVLKKTPANLTAQNKTNLEMKESLFPTLNHKVSFCFVLFQSKANAKSLINKALQVLV